jgi:DNA invertase Pin-like site-specific DNA recombinase
MPASPPDQQPQLQIDPLEPAGCYRVFTETASGARTDRPVLEQVLDSCGPVTPEAVLCWCSMVAPTGFEPALPP